jgi:membrane protease YdiL (CAAX protease family)
MPAAQRVGAAIEVILCSGFPTQLLLIGFLSSAGLRMQTDAGRLSSQFVFAVSLLDTAFVVGLILLFIRTHRESARALLIGHRPLIREALLGVILMPILFILVFIVLALILTYAPQLHNVWRNPFEDMMQTRHDALAFALVVMIAGGVREEIQRGFILRRFEQYLGGGKVGVVIFSVVFGLGHIEQGIDAMLATGLLGAAWGAVFLARGSVCAPMVSHALFNLAQLVKYVELAVR